MILLIKMYIINKIINKNPYIVICDVSLVGREAPGLLYTVFIKYFNILSFYLNTYRHFLFVRKFEKKGPFIATINTCCNACILKV